MYENIPVDILKEIIDIYNGMWHYNKFSKTITKMKKNNLDVEKIFRSINGINISHIYNWLNPKKYKKEVLERTILIYRCMQRFYDLEFIRIDFSSGLDTCWYLIFKFDDELFYDIKEHIKISKLFGDLDFYIEKCYKTDEENIFSWDISVLSNG